MITLPAFVPDIVLLLVRLMLTATFIYEARLKFKDIPGFAKSHSAPIPAVYFAATAEFLAGISMFIGLLTFFSGIGIILLMLYTTYLCVFKWHTPYWAQKGGWEYDILMIVLALVIVAFGAGRFALDTLICHL